MHSRELVKLYYRIGEVSDIVGVQPHVLRYWETEFRSIRPQKSSKGQRVYSRRDVEKLLRVKDLLKNQGFTIAGARKRLSEPTLSARDGVALAREEVALAREEPASEETLPRELAEAPIGAKNMRKVLLGLRQDLIRMLDEISMTKTT
jgi:DNA-binding transcriptional MerR regulator